MTVFVYVNTAKPVGDAEHIKVFSSIDAAEKWFEENDPEGVAFEYEVNEPHQPQDHLRRASDRGAAGHLAVLRIALTGPPVHAGRTLAPNLKHYDRTYGHAHNAVHIRLAGSRDGRWRRLRFSHLV
jgi:hypothetical protein